MSLIATSHFKYLQGWRLNHFPCSLFQCLTTLWGKKFSIISNINLLWHNLILFLIVFCLLIGRRYRMQSKRRNWRVFSSLVGDIGGLLCDATGDAHFSPFLQSLPSLKRWKLTRFTYNWYYPSNILCYLQCSLLLWAVLLQHISQSLIIYIISFRKKCDCNPKSTFQDVLLNTKLQMSFQNNCP